MQNLITTKKRRERQVHLKRQAAKNNVSYVDTACLMYAAEFGKLGGDLLEVKTFTIEDAGLGVFAKQDVLKGTYFTVYAGRFKALSTEPSDVEYTIQVEGGYVFGLKKPVAKKGVASFINRADRKLKCWMNCEFWELEDHTVVAVATQNVRAGCEFFAAYSKGYRISIKNKRI